MERIALYHDSFQNWKSHDILKAQLILTDIPFQLGVNAYGLIFYRDKLPKFRNGGCMVFTCMNWLDDKNTPKVHPTQKPVPLLEKLISIFTDVDDVVIDCCAGSGTTLLAANNLGRRAYGFELKKEFVNAFYEKILPCSQKDLFIENELSEKRNKRGA